MNVLARVLTEISYILNQNGVKNLYFMIWSHSLKTVISLPQLEIKTRCIVQNDRLGQENNPVKYEGSSSYTYRNILYSLH